MVSVADKPFYPRVYRQKNNVDDPGEYTLKTQPNRQMDRMVADRKAGKTARAVAEKDRRLRNYASEEQRQKERAERRYGAK